VRKLNSLKEVQKAVKKNEISCQDLVKFYLDNIQDNQNLNAFVEVYETEALAQAKVLDKKLDQSPENLGKLFGLVISIKDVLCYKNHKVSASSKILDGFESLFSSTAVKRLLAEDAIIIGRTNCDEFAMGSTNETSYFGATKNAADTNRVPGGSSGGAAVSVQADMCLAALGSDTGGSVRQPAAWCGVVGFKPTYGRISRHGLLAYASSFDQIGIFASQSEDVAIILEVIAGADDYDSTVSTKVVEAYNEVSTDALDKKKIAYFPEAINHEGIDKNIKAATFDFINQLREEGHTVEEVPFEYIDYLVPTYYVLTTAEASSNLSRYDGVRYGHRATEVQDLQELYRKSRTEGFGKEVKKRIMLGTFVLSVGYYDAYYTKAQQVRRLIKDKKNEIFGNYDFILMPTTPNFPPVLGASEKDPISTYLADIYTVFANLAGVPAISIPIHTTTENVLPIGVQLIANDFQEQKLLTFAKELEQMSSKCESV
jgi:aspartyl-tRNA(Asn)/glutamyl-tRNA(Gln) amidotransferase subunit A